MLIEKITLITQIKELVCLALWVKLLFQEAIQPSRQRASPGKSSEESHIVSDTLHELFALS